MNAVAIPIVGTVLGTVLVLGITAVVLHFKLEEARLRIAAEIQRMDMAYQRARQSLSR